MGRKVRSAKGELVDFDLLKIKQQMTTAPTPTDVKARQDFVDKRIRRRLRKPTNSVQSSQQNKEQVNKTTKQKARLQPKKD